MDDLGIKTFRLNVLDIKTLMAHLEKNMGPNRFSRAIERKLLEEFVEREWEIKRSPVPEFETNLEYLFSLIPKLYQVTKELSENAGEFASSLVHLLRTCQDKNTIQLKKFLN